MERNRKRGWKKLIFQRVLPLSEITIEVRIIRLGEDFQIIVQGGMYSHIGCTVLAVPRESLSKTGNMSCTSSVINVIGHKDEEICRYLAEKVASNLGKVTVCTGGIHIDGIVPEQISEIRNAVMEIGEEMVKQVIACDNISIKQQRMRYLVI